MRILLASTQSLNSDDPYFGMTIYFDLLQLVKGIHLESQISGVTESNLCHENIFQWFISIS